MSSVLKLTLATGEVHEVPFLATSSLSVETAIQGGSTIVRSYTDVAAVELLEVADAIAAHAGDDTVEMLSSPAVAIVHAKTLPLADAAAHVERALMKFPDDEDLAQVWADLGYAVQSGAETWSTSVEPDVDAIAAEPEQTEQTTQTEPDPATLESADAAIEHATTLPLEEAAAHIDAALAKFPDDADLAAAKTELADMIAAENGS